MRRTEYYVRLAFWSAAGLIAIVPLAGQDVPPSGPGSSEYRFPEQAQALNKYIDDELKNPTAEELGELSRLLSDPDDQIVWLSEWAENWAKNEAQREAAQKLIEVTEGRVRHWKEDVGVEISASAQARLSAVKEKVTKVSPAVAPSKLTDPAQFRQSLDDLTGPGAEKAAGLSPEDKYVLVAWRGITALPPAEKVTAQRWDAPRAALEKLYRPPKDPAGAATLPAMWELLAFEQELRSAHQDVANDPQSVQDAYKITAALLGRAMGVDGQDRGVPDEDKWETWVAVAERLEKGPYWQWLAAARLLQAACSPDPSAVLPQIQDALAKDKQVAGDSAPLLVSVGDWLKRLEQAKPPTPPGALDGEGYLPLSHDFREAARQKRQEAIEEFKKLVSKAQGNDPNAADAVNQAFRWMQLAKSRALGLADTAIPPIEDSMKIKKEYLGKEGDPPIPDISLFLEVLEVDRQVYGLALSTKSALLKRGDEWVGPRLIGPKSSLAELAGDALDLPVAEKRGYKDGRIVYAPDVGGRTSTGIADVEKRFGPRIAAPGTDVWLVYLPSAAALVPEQGWTVERALRLWYQACAGLQSNDDQPVVDVYRYPERGRGPRLVRGLLKSPPKLLIVNVGGKFKKSLDTYGPGNEVVGLMGDKAGVPKAEVEDVVLIGVRDESTK